MFVLRLRGFSLTDRLSASCIGNRTTFISIPATLAIESCGRFFDKNFASGVSSCAVPDSIVLICSEYNAIRYQHGVG